MAFRLRISWKYVALELLMLATAVGLSAAVLVGIPAWLVSPGQTSILEVMAILLALFTAAGFWGAALGGLFGEMKIVGRIAAYGFLFCLTAFTLSAFAAYFALVSRGLYP